MICSMFFFFALLRLVSGHGRLITPVPRSGVHPQSYELNPAGFAGRPATEFICRHSTPTTATPVTAGAGLSVRWLMTAPHPGDCSFYISYDYNKPLTQMTWFKVANEMNCYGVRKGQRSGNGDYIEHRTITLPKWLPAGRAVIRWEWTAIHVPTAVEHYIQCADISVTATSDAISVGQIPRFQIFNAATSKAANLPPRWTDLSMTPNLGNYKYSYRSAYNQYGNWPSFMTGPHCALDSKLNNCDFTKTGSQGNVPMHESAANPVAAPTPQPTPQPTAGSNPVASPTPQPTPQPTSGSNPVASPTPPPSQQPENMPAGSPAMYFETGTNHELRKTMANIAGLLGQCMWESGGEAPWSACDENNYTNSATAACTQRGDGQKYADLGGEDACARDNGMTMTAETHAAWTRGPMHCAPGTVTEGCCWWGRGAIQTTGRRNYGKLQKEVVEKLGLREDDGSPVDLCKNPEYMCQHDILKFSGAMYYWANIVEKEACFLPALDVVANDFNMNAAPSNGCYAFGTGVGGSINNGRWNSNPSGAAGRTSFMNNLIGAVKSAFTSWDGHVNAHAHYCTGNHAVDTLLELSHLDKASHLDDSKVYNWEGFCGSIRHFIHAKDVAPAPAPAPANPTPQPTPNPTAQAPAPAPANPTPQPTPNPTAQTPRPTPTPTEPPTECNSGSKYEEWEQCAGDGFVPVNNQCPTCPAGTHCYAQSEWWSACVSECFAGWDCENHEQPAPAPTPAPAPAQHCSNSAWSQCGGMNWSGPTCCPSGWHCTHIGEWYSQCI